MSLPDHIAIIPDGNRRWAKQNNLQSFKGHEKGADAVKEVLTVANDLGITYFTVWGSSIANLTKRPKREIVALQRIYRENFNVLSEDKTIHGNKVRVSVIGKWRELLNEEARNAIEKAMKVTEQYSHAFLTFTIAYDGKTEMVDAIKAIVEQKERNHELEITPELVKGNLLTHKLPPVDLLIRTGGEPHLSSGFMMWDIAEAQLYFTEKYWPDFTGDDLREAIKVYETRQRRLGK